MGGWLVGGGKVWTLVEERIHSTGSITCDERFTRKTGELVP
jgi:hypothetical protein